MGTIVGEDFAEETLSQARDLGKKLVRSWKEKIVIPEVEEVRKSLEERRRRVMLYCKEDSPYEFEVWKAHWGFE